MLKGASNSSITYINLWKLMTMRQSHCKFGGNPRPSGVQ